MATSCLFCLLLKCFKTSAQGPYFGLRHEDRSEQNSHSEPRLPSFASTQVSSPGICGSDWSAKQGREKCLLEPAREMPAYICVNQHSGIYASSSISFRASSGLAIEHVKFEPPHLARTGFSWPHANGFPRFPVLHWRWPKAAALFTPSRPRRGPGPWEAPPAASRLGSWRSVTWPDGLHSLPCT